MSPSPAFRLPPEEPPALHDRAMDNLQFIRDTMERAGAFTAVPGWGGVAIGVTALATTYLAREQATFGRWMAVWFGEAVLALVISAWAVRRKALRAGVPLLSGPGRRFALNFAPPMLVGGILTLVLYRAGLFAAIPGVWLLLYGTGIVAGGAFSVPVVPAHGVLLMITGAVALFTPAEWRDYFMAFGFGLLQITLGYVIARRYGG
jgi:hypothetical protein